MEVYSLQFYASAETSSSLSQTDIPFTKFNTSDRMFLHIPIFPASP